jgi:ankyrin repeat protein
LRCAAGGGYIEIVKLLLQYGADPNQPEPGIGPNGVALHAAISIRHLPIVKLLLEHGADPNGHVESSGNCLWMAKHVGAPQEMIDLLIAHGARLTLEMICYDGDAETLAHMLAANPQLEFNEDEHRVVLEKKQLVELILQYQPGILKRFCLRGFSDPELARWLISKGLDPNNGDWLGTRPLHSAATNGNIEMASVYLEAGADINIIDTDSSSTAMGWAARHGKKEMVEWLLQQGADPNLPEDEPWARPIAWAKRKGYEDIVALLNAKSKM